MQAALLSSCNALRDCQREPATARKSAHSTIAHVCILIWCDSCVRIMGTLCKSRTLGTDFGLCVSAVTATRRLVRMPKEVLSRAHSIESQTPATRRSRSHGGRVGIGASEGFRTHRHTRLRHSSSCSHNGQDRSLSLQALLANVTLPLWTNALR